MCYQGTFGIHFPIHQPLWVDHVATDLLRLAEYAVDAGFQAIWINDNFKARHTYSLMAAVAARCPVELGTLVTYPFARNPIDMATALGTVAELLGDREVRIGISTGAWAIQGRLVDQPRPTQSVQETIAVIRRLLDGEEVRFHEYPALAAYYHFREEAKLRLQFRSPRSPSFWIPPKGPRMLGLAAEVCDGVIFNTYTQYAALPAVRDGSLARTLSGLEQQRAVAGNTAPLRRIFKIDMSLAEDGEAARRFARNFVSFNAADDAERYRALGLPTDQLEALRARYVAGGAIEESAELVGRELIDWVVLAGTPREIMDRFAEYLDSADRLGFEQVILAVPVGPDPFKAIELASRELLPRVLGRTV